jgi:hypothetical protein
MTSQAPAPSRADVVFALLSISWLSTSQVIERLAERGFTFTRAAVIEVLRGLVEDGSVQRTRTGSSFYWRVTKAAQAREAKARAVPTPAPEPGALAPYVAAVERAVEELRRRAGDVPATLVQPTPAEFDRMIEAADLPDLFALDDRLVDRIVKRAVVNTLRAVVRQLDGFHEVGRENHESMGRREAYDDRLAPSDILDLLDGAAREVGVPEPWRAEQ